ncbi:putative inactive disease susceptibility protein LOV1 [Salvia miltiorrhiza]|uniref:putative inactive disease susceptibility protein LOV1 n=1 Tax=Salvia miltiorrhiza TaxID=226208 RepID=UPI0025AB79D2|nr:putative inactive disease susceptibility protein LOV1 [Salvia miltiorrhiza]
MCASLVAITFGLKYEGGNEKSVFERLEFLLTSEEAGLRPDVEIEVKGLQYDLKLMQAFLTRSRSSYIFERNDLRSKLMKIANGTEDIINTFCRGNSRAMMGYRYYGTLTAADQALHVRLFCKELSFIRDRLKRCKSRYGVVGVENPIMISEHVGGQQILPFWEGVVLGLEEDVQLLLRNVIFNEAPGLYTCCITGMAGIGKTTLARELYHHPSMDVFDRRAWVRVSNKSSQEEILRELIRELQSFGKDRFIDWYRIDSMNLEGLQHRLYKEVQGRRCFIVLDDIGEVAGWEPVLGVLSREDKGTRLLLTSRTRISVMHAQYIHVMKFLNPDQSWQLFLKIVFSGYGSNFKCPDHLKFVGGKILTRCNGLPLAIKEAGWRLAIKSHSESEWEEFLKSMDWSITSAVLESSLHKLPLEIKSCFLSLAFFKEGTTFRVEKLVQIWTRAGIISEEEGRYETAEQIARRYIYRLMIEYMVVIKDMTKDYRVKNIYINDNLHRLSVEKAKEVIGFEILRNGGHSQRSRRHCAICCSREKFDYFTYEDKHLLSLFFRGGCNSGISLYHWEKFEQLKILDLEGFGLKVLPESIGRLIELRYLGLRNNYLQELPESLVRLENLEVLDIALNFMVEVPIFITTMRSLRHLYMSDIIFSSDFEIDQLENIETLTFFPVGNRKYLLRSMPRITRLRKLGIQEMDDENLIVSDLFDKLEDLKNLYCLILRGSRYRSMPGFRLASLHSLTQLKLDGLLTRLPFDHFPPNISYVTLVDTCLNVDPMPILGILPKLFYLKLRNAYTGRKMVIYTRSFPKLGALLIGELWHLRKLKVQRGAMPMLERLEINSCPYLETLPAEIFRTNLQELKMVTTKKIARKIRESGLISRIQLVDIKP